jgi:hypothetical protein
MSDEIDELLKNPESLERFLMQLWPSLTIVGDDRKLEPYKLLNRTESVRFEEPFLYFDIERHGATVQGSITAEVHTWRVNLATKQAEIIASKKRRVAPADERLDVKPLAAEIADAIQNHKNDRRLKWVTDNKVRVLIQDIIPATNKQTTSNRRRRFYEALEPRLENWQRKNSFFEK